MSMAFSSEIRYLEGLKSLGEFLPHLRHEMAKGVIHLTCLAADLRPFGNDHASDEAFE